MVCNMDLGSFIGKMAVFIEDTMREVLEKETGSFLMEKQRVFAGVFGEEEF